MNRTIADLIASGALLLILFGHALAQYDSVYYGEKSFRKPIPVSAKLEDALRSSPDFNACGHVSFDKKSFQATKVFLGANGRSQILVKGKCGNSATPVFFWIFRRDAGKFTPIFFTAARNVGTRRPRSKGFLQIHSFGGCLPSACLYQMFEFDGNRYEKKTERWDEVKLPDF